jgi:hypothetical protein
VKNISPVHIKRALDTVGKVQNAICLKTDALVIELLTKNQAEVVLKTYILG